MKRKTGGTTGGGIRRKGRSSLRGGNLNSRPRRRGKGQRFGRGSTRRRSRGRSYERGFQTAYKQGYKNGFAKGFEDGHQIAYEQPV